MHINILGFAIPLFVGLILTEYVISKKKGLPYFNLHSSIANISIGIAERLADVFVAGIFYYVYDTVQKNYGLFNINSGVFVWILLFLATDFIWYWYHRLGHEINIFWMAHIVHHQSEDYNLTVSARITVFQAILRHGFWLILPLLGFNAGMITIILLVHGLYPFFIHTRLIGKLGILEYILVTPSHHRVHHASNEKYLDKNYGDVLIIWDKLFGTFQKEEEAPVYGLTKPLNTYSFLWQHFHFFIEIGLAVKHTRGFTKKLKVLFGKPEKVDPSLRKKAEEIFSIRQSQVTIDKPLNKYVVWQMIVLLISLSVFILFEQYTSVKIKVAFSLVTILTLINCGAIMEQKRWVFYMEYIRLAVLLYLPFYSTSYWQMKTALIIFVLCIIISYYNTLQKNYYRYVLK
ncbi:sterol desaturase family protein [Ferruginibacter sp.]|nr:sterol desaturase family protein [Ferruginibacter sp.]